MRKVHYQPAIVRHSFHHCSLQYYLSLRTGLGMYRELRSTFFRSVNRETKLVLIQYSDLNCLANGPCYRCHSSDFINSLTSCFDSVGNIFPDFQFQYAIAFTEMFFPISSNLHAIQLNVDQQKIPSDKIMFVWVQFLGWNIINQETDLSGKPISFIAEFLQISSKYITCILYVYTEILYDFLMPFKSLMKILGSKFGDYLVVIFIKY